MVRTALLSLLCALTAAPVTGQGTERWKLTEEVRIGSIDDPDYALTAVGDVAVGREGQVFIVQDQANQIVVFDSYGRRRHVVGRRGGGPGEFVGTVALTWVGGDTLGAFDLDQQRFSLFLPDGTHLRTGRILPEGSIGMVVLESLLGDGTALGYPRSALHYAPRHGRGRDITRALGPAQRPAAAFPQQSPPCRRSVQR